MPVGREEMHICQIAMRVNGQCRECSIFFAKPKFSKIPVSTVPQKLLQLVEAFHNFMSTGSRDYHRLNTPIGS